MRLSSARETSRQRSYRNGAILPYVLRELLARA